jgi:hypothetical protein
MSKIVSWDDFSRGRFERTGETIIVVNAEGKIIATIEPRDAPPGGAPYPFHDIDFGAPVDLPFDPAELIIQERDLERSGKKHGV